MGSSHDPALTPQVRDLELEEANSVLGPVDLSDWFNPFLGRLARESLRSGGRARVAELDGRPVGVLLSQTAERTASIFARSRPVVELLLGDAAGSAVYAEVDLGAPREPFTVHVGQLGAEPSHRFRHSVRLLGSGDVAGIASLLGEVYGEPAERWLGIAAEEGERAVGVETDATLVGVAWVLVVGPFARLHGLTVRPGYRRAGIGTDLAVARLAYARRAGARTVLSEISERNEASRAIAERVGMPAAGQLYLYPAVPSRLNATDPGAGPTSG